MEMPFAGERYRQSWRFLRFEQVGFKLIHLNMRTEPGYHRARTFMSTSLTLLSRLKKPGPGADWDRFVSLYTPMLYGWARRTGLSEIEAEDLVQDVFLVLLAKLGSFDRQRDGSFRKWLKVVTVNKCRERFRRKKVPVAAGSDDSDPLNDVADPTVLTEFWELEYQQQLVRNALRLMQAEFTENVWRACWEHVVQDRPAQDVGTELGLTANAVRVYSSRVLARLRDEFADLLDE